VYIAWCLFHKYSFLHVELKIYFQRQTWISLKVLLWQNPSNRIRFSRLCIASSIYFHLTLISCFSNTTNGSSKYVMLRQHQNIHLKAEHHLIVAHHNTSIFFSCSLTCIQRGTFALCCFYLHSLGVHYTILWRSIEEAKIFPFLSHLAHSSTKAGYS